VQRRLLLRENEQQAERKTKPEPTQLQSNTGLGGARC
jgi:hypothetical protein